MHLNEPAWQRYMHWLIGLLSGNPGPSLVNGDQIAETIGCRLTNSLLLAVLTALVSVPIALAWGSRRRSGAAPPMTGWST